MNTQTQDILDEEYKEALREHQWNGELLDEIYENLRSNWIMQRVKEGVQKLIW